MPMFLPSFAPIRNLQPSGANRSVSGDGAVGGGGRHKQTAEGCPKGEGASLSQSEIALLSPRFRGFSLAFHVTPPAYLLMPDEFSHEVFLSHGSNDNPMVRDVAEWLRKDGQQASLSTLNIQHSTPTGTFRYRDLLNKERRFLPLRTSSLTR